MSVQLDAYRGGVPRGLKQGTPRPLRLTRKIRFGLSLAIAAGVGWFLMCMLGTFLLARSVAKPWQELHQHGQVVEGRITQAGMIKGFGRTSRNYIQYEFTTAEGQLINGQLQSGVAQQVNENQKFTYLPNNPSQHVIGEVDDKRLADEERTKYDWVPIVLFLAVFPNLIGGLIVIAFVVGDLLQVRFAKVADLVVARVDQVDSRGFHYVAQLQGDETIAGRTDVTAWNGQLVQVGDSVPLLKRGSRVELFPQLSSVEWRDPEMAICDPV